MADNTTTESKDSTPESKKTKESTQQQKPKASSSASMGVDFAETSRQVTSLEVMAPGKNGMTTWDVRLSPRNTPVSGSSSGNSPEASGNEEKNKTENEPKNENRPITEEVRKIIGKFKEKIFPKITEENFFSGYVEGNFNPQIAEDGYNKWKTFSDDVDKFVIANKQMPEKLDKMFFSNDVFVSFDLDMQQLKIAYDEYNDRDKDQPELQRNLFLVLADKVKNAKKDEDILKDKWKAIMTELEKELKPASGGGAKHKKTKRRTKRKTKRMRKSMRKTKRRHKSKKRRKTKRRRRKR